MIVHLVTTQLSNRSFCERCNKSVRHMNPKEECVIQNAEQYDGECDGDEALPDDCYSCSDVDYMLEGYKDPYDD